MNSYYEKILATGEVKCIDEEIPFDVPVGWEWCRLGELISYQNGYAYTSSELNKECKGMPVIKSGNLMTYEVVLKPNNDYVEKPSTKMLTSVINKGDLLMCLSSQSDNPEPLGKTAIYKANTPALLNQRVLKMRPWLAEMLEYMYYVINSEYFHYTVSHQGGGSAQANLKLGHVLSMLVPLAPLEEAVRIVDKITAIMPLVLQYETTFLKQEKLNLEINNRLKSSILQEAIQGKLVPQIAEEGTAHELLEQIKTEKQKLVKEGKLKKSALNDSVIFRGDDNKYYTSKNKDTICIDDEIPFEIPDSWVWVRFGTIMINRDRERIPLSVTQRQFLSNRYDYYGASGVIDKVDRYLFDKELLLIGEDGANLLNRSTPIAFIAKGKYWVNNHAHVLDVYDGVMLKYIALYINSISLVPYVTGTAQPKMNQEKMNSILIALPPQKEQQRIVAQIEKLFEQLH